MVLRYSPSALGLYQACPRAYEFKYISNAPELTAFTSLPLKKGSMVHKLMELSDTLPPNEVLSKTVSQFNDYDLVKELYEEIKKTTLVDGFYNNLFSTERKMYFSYNEIEFMGIIDRINKYGEKDFEVIDYKYGKNEYTNMNAMQPQLYAWAMFNTFGFDIKLRFSYYNIQHQTKYSKVFTPNEVDMDAIAALALKSQTDYSPKSGFGCIWCSYLHICQDGKDFLNRDIELDGEDIKQVGQKLLDVKERQSVYNYKRKKYEDVLKMYFDFSGNTELKIDQRVIRYDPDSRRLVI